MDEVFRSFKKASSKFFKSFSNNLMKGNTDKCHLLVGSSNTVNIRVEDFDKKL